MIFLIKVFYIPVNSSDIQNLFSYNKTHFLSSRRDPLNDLFIGRVDIIILLRRQGILTRRTKRMFI